MDGPLTELMTECVSRGSGLMTYTADRQTNDVAEGRSRMGSCTEVKPRGDRAQVRAAGRSLR